MSWGFRWSICGTIVAVFASLPGCSTPVREGISCGAGRVCPDGLVCAGDDRCYSTDSHCELGTVSDCSECGDACGGSTPVCAPDADGFSCASTCAPPNDDICDGRCFDLDTAPGHCGSCGNTCAFDNANDECIAGECAIAECQNGFADCNGGLFDGCEIPLGTESDCGACGDACGGDDRCVAGDAGDECNSCDATNPTASGSAQAGFGALCGIDVAGNELVFRHLVIPMPSTLECATGAGSLTFEGVTLSGGTPPSLNILCRVTASGDTLTLTRLDDEAESCSQSAGTIQIAGADLSGSADANICGVGTDNGNLVFRTFSGPFECLSTAGVITMAAVCTDTL